MHKGETNDNSLVKLKTIIYFHMTEEEKKKPLRLPLNGSHLFSMYFQAVNACFYETLLCFVQSTHFRFIKQNMHLIHMRVLCALYTAIQQHILSGFISSIPCFHVHTSNCYSLLKFTSLIRRHIIILTRLRAHCLYTSLDVYVLLPRIRFHFN